MPSESTPRVTIGDERQCEQCGKALPIGTKRTCSKACAYALMWAKRRARKPAVYPQRTCPGCGGVMLPRAGESPSIFKSRKTCSPACGRAVVLRAITYVEPPRTCEVCGTLYAWQRNTSVAEFRQRRTCSRSCGLTLFYQENPRHDLLTGRVCVVCGDSFGQRKREPTAHYLNRKTCSRSCMANLSVAPSGFAAGQRKAFPSKVCPVCQTTFDRLPDENVGDYRKRKTCSRECGGKLISRSKRVEPAPKWCVICGQGFQRKPKETLDRYQVRVTCDVQCSHIQRGRVRRNLATRVGPYPSTWTPQLRQAIRARDGHCCRLCAATPGRHPLHVHHISGDKQDCRPGNLITLCHPCHVRAHSTSTENEYKTILTALIMEIGAEL